MPGATVSWHCESDPAARRVLAEHYPGVKCYCDVRDVDATASPVDLICGGFPCQPHSVAGKRKGTGDARWLWPEFARVVAALRPALVFIENVPGLRTSGLRDVLCDLARLGFDAEWDSFSAAEVGAPHRRRRIFILAYAQRERLRNQPGRRRRPGGQDAPIAHDHGGEGDVAHPDGVGELQPGDLGRPPIGHGRTGAWPPARSRGEHVADEGLLAHANGEGQLQQSGPLAEVRRRPGRRRLAADGAHADGLRLHWWAGVQEAARASGRDAAEGGDSWWAAEPGMGRVAHGVPARVDRLRLLGNACVPSQAALAFRELLARL